MPYYKGEAVSDAFVQGLCAAYREGMTQAGSETGEGEDTKVIARCESAGAEQIGAAALGLLDGGASNPSVEDAIAAVEAVQIEAEAGEER